MIDRECSDPPSARPRAHCRAMSCHACLPGRLPRMAGLDWRVSDGLRLLQHVGRVSWPGGSVASGRGRGRIKQQLWPRRVVCDSISRGCRQQRQPWETRPDKTRPARQDRTRVQGSWRAIGGGPLALPARDPLAQARNRGHGSAPERRLRLFSCSTLPSARPSIPSTASSHPILPGHPPSLPNHTRRLSVAPVTARPGSAGATGNRRKHQRPVLEVPVHTRRQAS